MKDIKNITLVTFTKLIEATLWISNSYVQHVGNNIQMNSQKLSLVIVPAFYAFTVHSHASVNKDVTFAIKEIVHIFNFLMFS